MQSTTEGKQELWTIRLDGDKWYLYRGPRGQLTGTTAGDVLERAVHEAGSYQPPKRVTSMTSLGGELFLIVE